MSRKPANIISVRMPMCSQSGDFHDVSSHRYYGSSACNGGERLSETRRPSLLSLFGFQNLG